MEISSGKWPADVLIDILLKLPAESIVRFKCVAKTWRHLLQNPTFVSLHHSITKKTNKQHLVTHYPTGYGDYIYNDLRLFVDEALISYHDLHEELPSHCASKLLVMQVDNGLFCLFDNNYGPFCITLWNPAIRQFRILPDLSETLPPKADEFTYGFGFGFDPLCNDYKVVYILDYFGPDAVDYAIYSVRRDSWRVFKEEEVKLLEQHRVGAESSTTPCVNGVFYWHAFERGNGIGCHPSVAALNLGTEVFQLIASPLLGLERSGQLMPLHDRIAIWDTLFERYTEITNDVWVLNDEGQWTKVLKIKPVLEVEKMFGFWRDGKVLLESLSGQLLLYDLETEEAKEVGIQTVEGGGFLWVDTYEESLVALE